MNATSYTRPQRKSYELGTLPPQALDAEEIVIGSALNSTFDTREALRYLAEPHFFYKEAHQRIWNAIIQLSAQGIGVDIITVNNYLRTTGEIETVGGMSYVMSLNAKVGSTAHLQEHCLIVKQEWMKRELMIIGSQIMRQATDDTQDPFNLLTEAAQSLDNVSKQSELHQESIIASVAKEAVLEASSRMGKPVSKFFLASGVPEYDKKLGGYAKNEPDLIILAGRPGMGKSAVLAWECAYQISQSIPVGIFSLEMSKAQLVNRMVVSQAEGQVNNTQLKYGSFNKDQYIYLERGASKLYPTPSPIYDRGGLDVRTLRTIALQWKEKYDTQLLYIDYLQLLRFGSVTDPLKRNTEVSIALKTLAKELGHPVIAIASLSRGPESRADKRPNMSDLRESGQIESDADVVKFLLRQHYYDKKVDYRDMLIIVEKNRHGEVGDIPAFFDVATNRPVNLSTPLPIPNATRPYKDLTQPNKDDQDLPF